MTDCIDDVTDELAGVRNSTTIRPAMFDLSVQALGPFGSGTGPGLILVYRPSRFYAPLRQASVRLQQLRKNVMDLDARRSKTLLATTQGSGLASEHAGMHMQHVHGACMRRTHTHALAHGMPGMAHARTYRTRSRPFLPTGTYPCMVTACSTWAHTWH